IRHFSSPACSVNLQAEAALRSSRGLANMEIQMYKTFVNAGATTLIAAAAMSFSGFAMAGECPAGKVAPDGQGQQAGATMPKDVTDTVLASIDLSKEMVKLDDHLFRMRRLEIKPGGIVPWHSHADRPALIYVVQGTITEYASI